MRLLVDEAFSECRLLDRSGCDRTVANHADHGSEDFVLCAAIPFAT